MPTRTHQSLLRLVRGSVSSLLLLWLCVQVQTASAQTGEVPWGGAPAALDLTVVLQGAYTSSGSALMRTDLLAGQHLPSAAPYEAAPWSCANPPGGGPPPPPPPPTVVDWVLVELRSGNPSAPPMTREACTAALLLSDGSVVARDGVSPVSLTATAAGSYYVAVYHRNHLAVLSATAVAVAPGSASYDFTQAGAAYGTNPQIEVAPGVFALWAGNGNADGQVTAPDFNLYASATTAGATGYQASDYNLDGQITAPDFNLYAAGTAAGAASSAPPIARQSSPE